MYYLGSMDQESESGLAWWFWLRVSHDVIAKMVAQASVIWRFNRSETTSQIIWWLLAGISFSVAIGQKPCSSPDNHHSFSECCNDMATDFPQNECPKREREPKMEGTVVYKPTIRIDIPLLLQLIGSVFQSHCTNSGTMKEETIRGCKY